ncbi:MAG: ATP-binding protein [Gammaproteobacteria bacterium]|nr:ATP-binding protein [Gammaproteobacteria bacterium]MYA36540.1 HAMP domain-containing histidine kinase [Gammaproteobacteria bacterium]MYA67634.1 HAMP domain-containing histidine kinase [Gammaproteobacteria bacterium]MYH46452.1 HAMP domain-containing histidine kinase [Gammaproteobacteria bacterium]MYH84750.1 HAMP domain-containing histidine kinase [Gammaproteobacteria bacterium]
MRQFPGLNRLAAWLIPVQSGDTSLTRQGLQRLLLLRAFVTGASCAGLFALMLFPGLDVPGSFIAGLVAAIVVSILLGYWRLNLSRPIGNTELFLHILVDVVFLVLLLLNTGGVGNPLISYLLVLLAVTATLLPRAFVNSFAVGSILIYTFFLLLDLSAEQNMPGMSGNAQDMFELHLVGMWVIFVVSAVLITVFISAMAIAVRDREHHLAEARENEMRNEQLVAIGTLAAGTAHALGTPLSTMAVILNDLDDPERENLEGDSVKQEIGLLREQVSRCKHSINQLIRYYHKDDPSARERVTLARFAADIQDYILNVHPAARVEFKLAAEPETPLDVEPSLRHAVINIIENGIKAARKTVDVDYALDPEDARNLLISVTDDGPGIPEEVLERIGEPFVSRRKDSMGLGIFLANAALRRAGGNIEMFNRQAGGALTLIRLPLTSEAVS